MASKSLTLGVYIGRFQPFHLGHKHVLMKALAENDQVLVILGSANQARTIKNPFTVADRRAMIIDSSDANGAPPRLRVESLQDVPHNNAKWIESVQSLVDHHKRTIWSFADPADMDIRVTLYGSQRDSSTWYLNAFPQWGKSLSPEYPVDLSATRLRELLFTGRINEIEKLVPPAVFAFIKKWRHSASFPVLDDEYAFITEYKKKWESAPYPVNHVTTDAVVIQSGHVLVIERNNFPGRGLWAFPGGFLKTHLTRFENTLEELFEETDFSLADGKKAREITRDILRNALVAEKTFDDPNRSLRGRTITTAFFFRLDDTKPLPKVRGMNVPLSESGGKEIVETRWAKWIPLAEARANPDKWFEDHHSILEYFLG